MKRGNERVELLRSGIGLPRERIVGPIAGKKIARDDSQMSFFTERVASGSHMQEITTPVSTAETDELQGERCEIAASGKVTHVSSGVLGNYKIPKLMNKKVRAEGSVPKILVLRSRSAAVVEEPELAQPPLRAPLTVVEEQERPAPSARPAPIEELPRKHVVTIVPTPRKQRARTPKLEVDAVAPAPAPKPLKVIRRRREETPKVFETTAKSFPRAMLEGIDIELGENNHGQID